MGKGPQTSPRKGGSKGRPEGLHPRNRHQGRYDFPALVQCCPELATFVSPNPYGDLSIDFANPRAVRALNKALLVHYYGVEGWEIPAEYLCPPIPGRADYIHQLADLLASGNGGKVPEGRSIRVLDIGTGANCIYPILGNREYGWSYVGTDIDPRALASARRVLQANPGLCEAVELRQQPSPDRIFSGVVHPGEGFHLSMCNPPFHASAAEAREGTQRKWRNLGREVSGKKAPTLNFGGQGAELWCPGGEGAFLRRMIEESADLPILCLWFTALVSKSATLPGLQAALRKVGALEVQTIEMAQGQKKSRILAWSFLDRQGRQVSG